MIHGPFSDEYFWDDDSDPESLDPWNDHLSAQSNDDWGWDEWGDLVVFRPVGHEARYEYPLILWLSLDDVRGVTLRDWFPDLSDRNYLGAEVQISPTAIPIQNFDRVAISIRELSVMYKIHPRKIWIAGAGPAANWVLRILPALLPMVTGAIAIAPSELSPNLLPSPMSAADKTLYLATEVNHHSAAARLLTDRWDDAGGEYQLTEWESIEAARLGICRDLNVWLMDQVCVPAGRDSRD